MPELQNVAVRFQRDGATHTVFESLSLTFEPGLTTVLSGPSGCGKTTVLRLLAGLISPDSGNVTRETEVAVATLFQDLALFPWLTAEQNVNLVLSDSPATLPAARAMLDAVGLSENYDSYPADLSGGMCQRVALARALVRDADLLLLDEPFRGLDPALHLQMLSLVKAKRAGKTTVIVSHDPTDLSVADRHISFRFLNDNLPTVDKIN